MGTQLDGQIASGCLTAPMFESTKIYVSDDVSYLDWKIFENKVTSVHLYCEMSLVARLVLNRLASLRPPLMH